MHLSAEDVLAECLRLESLLQDFKDRAIVPQPDALADWEHELASVASSLEILRQAVAERKDATGQTSEAVAPLGNAVLRQTLIRIQRMAQDLGARFQHGSNYCAGLLQITFALGYSAQGLPVLRPNQSTNSFEG